MPGPETASSEEQVIHEYDQRFDVEHIVPGISGSVSAVMSWPLVRSHPCTIFPRSVRAALLGANSASMPNADRTTFLSPARLVSYSLYERTFLFMKTFQIPIAKLPGSPQRPSSRRQALPFISRLLLLFFLRILLFPSIFFSPLYSNIFTEKEPIVVASAVAKLN